MTPEQLRRPHRSLARNARICEVLFLTRYVEKYGTGTLMMIRESIEHALPEPDFDQREGEFSATLWRNWLTEKVMVGLGLNDRQVKAVTQARIGGTMTSALYRELTGCPPRTATRDLDDLVEKGILQKAGSVGRGARYLLRPKSAINRPNRPNGPSAGDEESAINRTNRTSQAKRNGPQTAHAAQKPSPETGPDKKPANRAAASRRKIKGSSNI